MSPSRFIVEWSERIAREHGLSTRLEAGPELRALDVAMGRGRHAVPLARAGFRTFGVDLKPVAVRDAIAAGARAGVRIQGWCADLTQYPLPQSAFDLIVVCRYLQRDLFPALRAALAPGGVLLYETFTTAHRQTGRPPTSADHLLEPGELRKAFDDVDVMFYEEAVVPEAVARLAARSRS